MAADGEGGQAAIAKDAGERFDAAARLYEQGRYEQAAAMYAELLTNGVVSPAVLFNLGNAWFQDGQLGKAIAAYRRARALAPRDAAIRANLHLARSRLPPGVASSRGLLIRVQELLTANEWGLAALGAAVASGLLLLLREITPRWRPPMRTLTWWSGGVAALTLAAAAGSVWTGRRVDAVVVEPEVTVRYGPLKEAQEAFELPDGAEVSVRDRKDDWLMVRDSGGREGWLERSRVMVLPSPSPIPFSDGR